MKTKPIIITIIAIIVIFGIYQRVFHGKEIDKRNAQRAAEIDTPAINQDSIRYAPALAKIKAEPKVKEAIITDSKVMYASVLDDGTDRSGYAQYLCQVLSNQGITDLRIKIVKQNSSKDPKASNAYGILLGESDCRK
jgi:hypothetical protein